MHTHVLPSMMFIPNSMRNDQILQLFSDVKPRHLCDTDKHYYHKLRPIILHKIWKLHGTVINRSVE
jgi:hypothetical protein